jgi:flagellin-like hook-associated protein FlgL
MVTSRIGSLSLINDTLRDVTSSQAKLSELQNQISSGLKE